MPRGGGGFGGGGFHGGGFHGGGSRGFSGVFDQVVSLDQVVFVAVPHFHPVLQVEDLSEEQEQVELILVVVDGDHILIIIIIHIDIIMAIIIGHGIIAAIGGTDIIIGHGIMHRHIG